MSQKNLLVIVLVALGFWLGLNAFFVVDANQKVAIERFGHWVGQVDTGVHFKWPLVDDVIRVEGRPQVTSITTFPIAFGKKAPGTGVVGQGTDMDTSVAGTEMAISPFIVWQVTDVKRYLAGQASMQPQDTRQLVVERLSDQVSEALSKALAGQNLSALVTADHTDILEKVAHQVSSDMEKQVGVAVRKIGLLDVNWPESGRSTVYARMKADFASRVDAIVASGKAKAAETRAETDAQSTLLLAAAYRNSQKTRADGDAKASAIYAAAYGKNPEFYRFYRSLKAYRNSFGSGDLLVLSPDSDFFRYFRKAN